MSSAPAPAGTLTARVSHSDSARRFVRRLRGRSQAHLFEAADGNWYATKFHNNPQGVESLVNEVISTLLLEQLGVHTASLAFLEMPFAVQEQTPDIYLQCGSQRVSPAPGWHLGSRYPVSPDTTPLYDLLPARFLPRVHNGADFIGMFVYDYWSCHQDRRQAVFHRDADGFVATFIDHGLTCGGAQWQFRPTRPSQHPSCEAYNGVRGWQDLAPWVEQIESWTQDDIHTMAESLPAEWVARVGEARLHGMLDTLCQRRLGLADRLRAYLAEHPTVLPRYAQPIQSSAPAGLQLLAASVHAR